VRIFEKDLNDALTRGVKVELITSAKRDQPVYRYVKNYLLLRNLFHENIKMYEYPETLLHMKGYLIDGKKYSIGSFNNDRWSWKLNNELNIIGEDQSEADGFKRLLDHCK
jgi:cardiolipin synthase